MWALDQPHTTRTEPLLADTPVALLAALAVGATVVALLVDAVLLPAHALRVVGVGAGHGALIATALAWAGAGSVAGLIATALLGLAAAASSFGTLGAATYLAPALWIFWLAARGRLEP